MTSFLYETAEIILGGIYSAFNFKQIATELVTHVYESKFDHH